ncbi:hypothetical protein AGMMS49950_10920 [Endomicrobiia bacterium]|nr:hypothetical protein AGMMS49531_09020 [Endomicrobiia bacterium]GHT66745.1 hypothetical protein AGMMS49556_07940 [Endomicrobiia bacterium]GHT72452.1 hypothetical protein AGMMS49950_10920 [Endomicrobiia bacterium]
MVAAAAASYYSKGGSAGVKVSINPCGDEGVNIDPSSSPSSPSSSKVGNAGVAMQMAAR